MNYAEVDIWLVLMGDAALHASVLIDNPHGLDRASCALAGSMFAANVARLRRRTRWAISLCPF
jgi:hypothetical protein